MIVKMTKSIGHNSFFSSSPKKSQETQLFLKLTAEQSSRCNNKTFSSDCRNYNGIDTWITLLIIKEMELNTDNYGFYKDSYYESTIDIRILQTVLFKLEWKKRGEVWFMYARRHLNCYRRIRRLHFVDN